MEKVEVLDFVIERCFFVNFYDIWGNCETFEQPYSLSTKKRDKQAIVDYLKQNGVMDVIFVKKGKTHLFSSFLRRFGVK